MECSFSKIVGGFCYTKKDEKSNGVRSYGPEIGFNNRESKPLDNLEKYVSKKSGKLSSIMLIPVAESWKL